MIVAIHQPNYIPYLGYFYKLAHVDTFVIYDDVIFQHGNASSITNRVRVLGSNGPFLLTVPIIQQTSNGVINKVQIDENQDWVKKHLKSVLHSYEKAKYFKEVYSIYELQLSKTYPNLSELNTSLINAICQYLDIKTKIIKSSDLQTKEQGRNERLAEICQILNAKEYVSGLGAMKYNDPQVFQNHAIQLTYSEFVHPQYDQLEQPFVPGLSIIDALFNFGRETIQLLK